MQSSDPHDAGVGVGATKCELTYDDDCDTVKVDDAGHEATYDEDENEAKDEDAEAATEEEEAVRFS